ncbi:MAG TPA: exopolysaccharide biosynthesis polyprenyl glycosylphosphotransferase [Terriglobales bacterium]|nr:exopolysaccharide biosynthesis polyprenyl glycosylphosphotransferase [Terriglobales bacterium]
MSSAGIEETSLLSPTLGLSRPAARADYFSNRFERLHTATQIAADAVTVAAAVLISYSAYHTLGWGKHVYYAPDVIGGAAAGFAALFVLMLDRDGAYRQGSSLLRIKETERALRVSSQAFLLTFPATFFAGRLFSRGWFALAMTIVPLCLIAEKQLLFFLVRMLHKKGYGIRKTVIYGAGYTGRRVFSALARSLKLGLAPVAVVDDDPALAGQAVYEFDYQRKRPVPVVSGPVDRKLLLELNAEVLVVAIPSLLPEKFMQAASEAAAAGASVAFVPNQAVPSELWTQHVDVDGLLLSSIAGPAPKTLYEVSKRAFDFAAASALLLLLSPLLLAIALLVRLDSAGPVLFRQQRVGRHGKLFQVYKFRTMHAGAPAYSKSPTAACDPRITSLGRFLRRSSLDELPQLLNVLQGEMSLVGPRPEMPFLVEGYSPRHRQRLQVLPGITGLWQLSADRAFLIHENIQYDLYYIRNRSFFMDVAILLHTLVFAMRGV